MNDLNIFYEKYRKREKIKTIDEIGFKLEEFDKDKIMYEDIALKAYRCSLGVWTIGIGCTFYEDKIKVKKDDSISLVRALELYEWHKTLAKRELLSIFDRKTLNKIGKVREEVLLDLIFNMGRTKLSLFRNMIKALYNQDYEKAANELKYGNVEKGILSRYYTQVGDRAKDNVEKLRKGY